MLEDKDTSVFSFTLESLVIFVYRHCYHTVMALARGFQFSIGVIQVGLMFSIFDYFLPIEQFI